MDTRIGYPNEHLAGGSDEALSSPSFATAVGLLMVGLDKQEKAKQIEKPQEEVVATAQEEISTEDISQVAEEEPTPEKKKVKKSIFEKFTDTFRDFLDNAE